MSLPNETLLETGGEDLVVRPHEVLRVVAKAGASYRVVQGQDKELVTDVVAVRDGANLILHFADGAKVVIEEYFTLCERGDCEVTLPKDGEPSSQAMEQTLAEAVEDGHSNDEPSAQIVYVDGELNQVMDILSGNPALAEAHGAASLNYSDEGSEAGFYWSLIGLGVAYGLYEAINDGGGSAPLPVFAEGESATATVTENSPASDVVFDASATAPGQTSADSMITYSLAGTDAAAFTIDPATGEVRLNASPDFEAQPSYSFDVIATSDVSMSAATQSVAVSVTDVPLTLEGVVVAGPVVPGHGLTATAYAADGTVLGSAALNDDGTFSIDATPDDYNGLVLVRISDETPGPDYLHEGSGANEDLTIDLRAIGRVDDEGVIRVNVNLATEIAVRQLLSDSGGDGGNAPTVLGAATEAEANTHYSNVLRAFGLDPAIDLRDTDPHPVNAAGFSEADATAQMLGHVLAIIAALEVSNNLSTAEVLELLVEGSQAGVLSQELLTSLEAAAALVDTVDSNAGGTDAFFADLADNGVESIAISDDSGSSATDFLTNVASQTVSATLIAALSGDQAVYGSVDGGATWVDIAAATGSSVSGTAVSWSTSLSATAASSRIVIAVTSDGAEPAADASNISGRALSQDYVLDQTPPALSNIELDAAENGTAVEAGEATDENGIAATGGYTLSGTDAALFTVSDTGELTFVSAQNFEAPNDADTDGVYDVNITVTDAAGNSTTQAVAVNLQNVNEVPVVGTAIVDSTAVVDQMFSLDVSSSFSDPDAGDTLSYSATGLPAGLTISSAGVISGTATAAAAGTDIVVTATDDGGLTVTDTFSLTVVSAPTISAIALNGGAVTTPSGGSHTFDVTFSESVTVVGTPTLTLDINGTATTATYAAGSGSNTLTFTITGPAAEGSVVEITAISLAAGVTITGDTTNQPLITSVVGQTTADLTIDDTGPMVTTTSLNASENSAAVGSIAAMDANGIAATGGYSLGGTDAALFTINDAGVLVFATAQDFEAPGDADTDGVYDVNVTVTDVAGNQTTQAVAVNLQNVNEAPVVGTAIVDSTAVANQSFSLATAGAFVDPDSGDTLTYSATGLPAGLTISSAGVISGTATAAAAATDIVVTATDGGGLTVSDTFALTVVAAPVASTSLNDRTDVDVQSDIVLTFSENVTVATGNIRIVEDSATAFKDDATVNTQTIDVTSGMVTVSGNKVIIDPAFDLDFGSNYHIEIDAGAFTGDVSGLGSVVVNAASSLNFTTVTPTADGALAKMATSTDTVVDGYTYVDTAGQGSSGPSPSQVAFDAAGADYAFVGSLLGTGINQGYDAHIQVSNFAANTSTGAVTLGDVLYYDNQGIDNTNIYSGTFFGGGAKPNTVGSDGTDTRFDVSAASGQPGPNRVELLGVNIPVDSDAAWVNFTDYTVSAVLVG